MGELINLNAQVISDADIPAAIARDTEVTAAVAAHVAATDPHPVYLTATDPHPVYLTQAEGDGRYRQSQPNGIFFVNAALPTANIAGNSIGFGWNSAQPGLGIAEVCNYAGLGGGDAFNFFRMGGNAPNAPTLSHRVARIDISGAYIQTSDKRVKRNFTNSPGLAEIRLLSPKRYRHYEVLEGFDRKDKTVKLGKNFTQKIGLIAQEVRKVLPEAVLDTESEEELYGIDYACITACLVKAVQELENQVIDLKAQVQILLPTTNSG
ncbi:tail fiber domain-containing protein [Microcoleus sp. PH2017_08_TRC_O_A]|uniref:tail fiber domain-containing protein n=1 Tax=Microcoleus sp. PH2017_08_TRC_O_A TaxID=2798819 RepID=UPI001E07A905|nr:tail fiber domain-containing protein [Microcoleus sp. PH2017_08_TRC_O_A]MCC3455941.1 tail fiber domain-containing protein [Microcoleus sp. PH2017_08_TRC_O_A]